MKAVQLLEKGDLNQCEVARRLRVCRQTVSGWVLQRRQGGEDALKGAGRAGRKPELSETDRQRLQDLLLQGPEQLGYETPLWTCGRVAHLIESEFGVAYHPGHVWKVLDALGWSCQRPVGNARERNEEEIRRWRRTSKCRSKMIWNATVGNSARQGRQMNHRTFYPVPTGMNSDGFLFATSITCACCAAMPRVAVPPSVPT